MVIMNDLKLNKRLINFYLHSPRLVTIYRRVKRMFPNGTKIVNRLLLANVSQELKLELAYVNISDVSAASLSNVKVFGRSRFVRLDQHTGTLLIGDEASSLGTLLKQYLVQEEVLKLLELDLDEEIIHLPNVDSNMKIFGNWISLLDPSSNNWMHFLSEVLPNSLECANNIELKSFGILTDATLSKSASELIKIVYPGVPNLILHTNQPLEVESLIIGDMSKKSMSFFWPRDGENTLGSYLFSSVNLLRCRTLIFENMQLQKSETAESIKLYVKRKSYFRRVVNHDAVEEYLRKNNFVVFEPTENNLEEQIQLFSKAQIVVAQAGAALANIMFMPPDSRVFSLMADSDWIDFDYFHRYAAIFGVNFIPVRGRVVGDSKLSVKEIGSVLHPMNANFIIDTKTLERALSK